MTAQTILGRIFRSVWVERPPGRGAVKCRPCLATAGTPPEPDSGFRGRDPDPDAAPRTASRARRFRFRWNQLVTDGHTVAAAARIAAPETRSRRRRPVFNPPIIALRCTVPALIAAAMLLGAGAPVRAFPGLDRPSVSIAAERGSYGFGIDDVIFKLRRAGPADDAISVRVSLAQAHLYLPTDRLNAVVRFWAGKRDAELRIRARQFNGPATQSGVLSATLVAAFGYTVGHPDSARTRMVVKDPAITVRPEHAAYSFDEDDATATVVFVAGTAPGLPRPNAGVDFSVSSVGREDGAGSPGDYAAVSTVFAFEPGDFTASGSEWEARKEVALSIVDDGETEGDETFDLKLERAPGLQARVKFRQADGSVCPNDSCEVPVTLADPREVPVLTIAVQQESYGFGIDNVVFTVTRTGTAEGEISGAVDLTQDENFEGSFSRVSFTIPANETSTDVELFRSFFDGDATQSGGLTATIKAGDGYAVGTPGSATVRMVVADPAVTVRPELAAYSFDEDGAEATITVVARTAPGVPPPSGTFAMHVFSDRTSGTATVGDDYEVLGINVVFGTADFTVAGGVWEARKEVSLTIVDDDVAEADEIIDVRFRRTVFTPERIRPRNADGSACADDVCTVPVTIAANDGPPVARIEITPVPPAASADHGPYYIKDDFLVLPDDTVHGRGATLTFTLNLDTEVTVTGTPELVLDIFDRERRARYTGGSGSRQLTFTWTVEKGDNDPDGLEFRFLDLNGGTLWGRGAVTRFDGREGELTLDGKVSSAMVGVDWARENWTAGLIVSRSAGDGGYVGHSKGRVEATLTGLYPWGRLALSERVDVWGAAGYGTGELSVTPKKPGTDEDGATVRTDLHLRMAAAGLRGNLLDGGRDGFTLTGKTDALIVQTASDAARGPNGGGLAAARASVTRLRLGLEGSRPVSLSGGASLTPSVEIGVRHDGGDAETGFGIDFGGGIAWSDPKSGLSAELRGRGLLAHDARGFRERGFSGSLAWDPTPSLQSGPKLTLTQTVGASASGGADALLAHGTLAGLGAISGPEASDTADLLSRRLDIKLGYGFAAGGGRFASIPEIGFGLSDTGRDFSLGCRLAGDRSGGGGAFQLSAEARRYETDGGNRPPEHRIGVRLSARW